MKLSNKILIGLFSFLFLYMIVAFTEMRFKGDLNQLNRSNSISETVDIPRVNYIKLLNLDQHITILGADTTKIDIRSVAGDVLQYLNYDVIGDTLIIKSIELESKKAAHLYIYVSKSRFRGLSTSNSGVNIGNLQLETLDIDQIGGWVRMSDSNKIGQLNLNAQNSAYFNFLKGKIDTLNTTIDFSQVSVTLPMKLVKGSMKNASHLQLRGTTEIQFKKDENSKLILN